MTLEEFSLSDQLLTFTLSDQLFGIPVEHVSDVLSAQEVTPMPLAPPAISGVMNLRGHIVTAIDVRHCLGQEPRAEGQSSMSIVVSQENELFSLIIDTVGDVLQLSCDSFENVPATLDPAWRSVSAGIHKLQDNLLIILDVTQLLAMAGDTKTAGA